MKLRIRIEDGKARDFEFRCESTARWNFLSGTKFAAQDGFAKTSVNLTMQRDSRISVDAYNRKDS